MIQNVRIYSYIWCLTRRFLFNFVGGPAKLEDSASPDWVPSVSMGYVHIKTQTEQSVKRHIRFIERHTKRLKMVSIAIHALKIRNKHNKHANNNVNLITSPTLCVLPTNWPLCQNNVFEHVQYEWCQRLQGQGLKVILDLKCPRIRPLFIKPDKQR